MDTIEHFRRLFSYDDWANREVLTSLQTNNTVRSMELFAHIFGAQRIWFERLTGISQNTPVWPKFDLRQCQQQAEGLPKLWSRYLDQRTTLADPISYKNTRGESFSSRIEDILMHVVMHGAYHRGQIATDMRSAGHTPAYTDFIHSVRQGYVPPLGMK
jgi:uncharacterized damage-inducible protein DinB